MQKKGGLLSQYNSGRLTFAEKGEVYHRNSRRLTIAETGEVYDYNSRRLTVVEKGFQRFANKKPRKTYTLPRKSPATFTSI